MLALASASGFRIREVTLAGEWWLADNGPLLAFRADERSAACACLRGADGNTRRSTPPLASAAPVEQPSLPPN
jgi:hypothetical protein